VPLLAVFARHFRVLVLGTLAATVTFVVFYLMTVFALSWATSALKIPRQQFLELQMVGVLFFGATIPVSALIADRIGSRNMLKIAALLMIGMGFCFAPLFGAASTGPVLLFLVLGFGLAGLTYGPLGSALGELFPTAVRYTGTSLTFNFAGILGASLAPYIATALALKFGIAAAGYYLSGVAAVSLVALVALGATVALSPPGAEGLPKRASGNETLEFDRVDR